MVDTHYTPVEYPPGRLYRRDRWVVHAPMEFAQEQQQFHIVSIRILCISEFNRGCHGECCWDLLRPYHLLNDRPLDHGLLGHQKGPLSRQRSVFYPPRWLVLVHVRCQLPVCCFLAFEKHAHLYSQRAYAAYIAGILINVVGFAGASARLHFSSVLHDLSLLFSWSYGSITGYSNLPDVVLHRIRGVSCGLHRPQSVVPCSRSVLRIRRNRRFCPR